MTAEQALAAVRDEAPSKLQAARGGGGLSRRVDKGTGVLRALNKLGANPAADISFGDMPNDIPMFAVTGRAYAVGAGHPAVGAAARETLDPVERDGFARKILEFAASDWRMS